MSEQNNKITRLIRWSGLISLLAGVLYAVGALLHPVGEGLAAVSSPNWVPAHLIYWVAVMLMQLGLVGVYARQVEQTGWLGLVGFVLAFVGTALVSSILLYVSTALPLIAGEAQTIFDQAATPPVFLLPVFVLGFGLGWILLGVATMRAGVLPRWSGLLLIIGVTLFVSSEALPFEATLAHILVTVGDIIFGLGLVWMGYVLWSEKREPVKYGKSATRVSAS
jgi:hypothetical protein